MTPNNGRPVRVARYHRVSRIDQDPALQDDATADIIERRGWTLVETYVDHGVSGSRERRPGLDKMLADARRRRFDVVLVYRADRLFRSLRHMVVTLDDLSSLGIGFVSASEPFDTTTPTGRLLLHIVSAMGEFERGLLIERTRAGMAAARRRGAQIGRPRVRVDMDRALELRQQGMSVRAAAKEMGIGAATLHRALVTAKAVVLAEDPQVGPSP
jgi:DNA invertase Pin-like site-specific DNA recombinase